MFVMVSENICTICLKNFHTEYGKGVATVSLFSETSNKECSNVLCEKPVSLMELFLELRIVVIQDSKDRKRSVCKKCARKIVNCYRMSTEFREAFAVGRALGEAKESAPRTPSSASLRGSIPIRGQRSRNWSDFKGEAAQKKQKKRQKKQNSTCENEAERSQRRPSGESSVF